MYYILYFFILHLEPVLACSPRVTIRFKQTNASQYSNIFQHSADVNLNRRTNLKKDILLYLDCEFDAFEN